jgi:nucleoside-diphosphate-sugar epimerase
VKKAGDCFATTILRPVAVFGPADQGFLEYFRLIKKGFLPIIGWSERLLSVVYVDDLVEGIINAARNPKAIGQTYFLGDDQPYSVREIGTTIAFVMHSTPVEIHLPNILVYAYGAISEVIGRFAHGPVLFNLQKAKEGVQRAWTCSVEKAKTDLQFFTSTSLYDGMRRSYEWYCQNGWL